MAKNFVSYADANAITTKIGQKLNALDGAYVFRGSVTFDNLPSTLTKGMVGYVYNVTDDFETDSRFMEGAGKKYAAGTDVAVALASTTYTAVTPIGTENPSAAGWYELDGTDYTLSTDTTVDSGKTYYQQVNTYKFDVHASFVDVDGLSNDIKAGYKMITDDFNQTENYAVGDAVIKDKKLYEFQSTYTAYTEVTPVGTENPSDEGWYEFDGTDYTETTDTTVDRSKTYYQLNDWDASKVVEKNVASMIAAAEPNSLTTEQLNALLDLIN